MKCSVCQEKGIKSNVYPGASFSTAMGFTPYYDENGKYHLHDMNTMSTSYSCSLGHRWSVSRKGSCPSCDFGSDSKKITIQNDVEVQPTTILNGDGIVTFSVGTGISSSSYATPQFVTLT